MKTNYNKAFFVAPLTVPLVTAIYISVFSSSETKSGSVMSLTEFVIAILLAGVPITYISVLILGLPVYFLLKESNALSIYSLFISGSITGLIVSVFIGTEGSPSLDGLTLSVFLMFFVISISSGIGAILFGKLSNDLK